jgi:hypothetical protein
MSSYKVSFFKDLLNSSGHRFKCLQKEVEIRRARSVERAVRAAERRFARLHRVRDWKLYADLLEVEIDGRKAGRGPIHVECARHSGMVESRDAAVAGNRLQRI